jgi:MoaA/NifB/PqqE/SkfB family radical SAM enzyme
MREFDSGTVGKGYLKFADFRNFIQHNKFVKNVELSNSGEIFLNPDLIHIIKYAFENNIKLHAMNGVNFNTTSDEILEALVKFRFRAISVSIDGASQEIYSLYRVNGNFNTVIENIKKLNKYKQKYNSKFPELHWQYIIMEHNEEDVIKAKEMAKELQMRIYFKLTWDEEYIPKNRNMLTKETGLKYLSRNELFETKKIIPDLHCYGLCYGLWNSPQINWDGRLLGCCSVFNDDFGVNVFDVGLKNAINSENYKYAKKMLTGKIDIPKMQKNIPCINCKLYKIMQETGIYI